jgi:hypothetical protein
MKLVLSQAEGQMNAFAAAPLSHLISICVICDICGWIFLHHTSGWPPVFFHRWHR